MIAATQPALDAIRVQMDSWSLRLDKYPFEREPDDEAKTRSLRAVVETYDRAKNSSLQASTRSNAAFTSSLSRLHGERCRAVELRLDSKLMLHLGRANVLENVGLYAERITGLPMIPGTAHKGVISTWACWEKHFNPNDGSFRAFTEESKLRENMARRILGDNSSDGSTAGGEIVFVGGYPMTPPKLGLYIVNPHHSAYGHDLERLTPNAFLCIKPGTTWRFVFFTRPGTADAKALLNQTEKWLVECLTQVGIGAKTAAGYGRFANPGQTPLSPASPESPAAPAGRYDYPNEATFQNRVLAKLDPGKLDGLRAEIETLKKPENAEYLQKLKASLVWKEMKEIRKRLASKDWFPKEWLPT